MQVIGLDVGFGFTKATNGRDTQIFKSVVGDAAESTFNEQLMPTKSSLGRHLQINGETYYIGELAEQQSRGRGYTLDPTQFLTKYAKTLAISACAPLADAAQPVRLVTGLPISSESRAATGRRLISGLGFPFGRPRCDASTTTAAPASSAY